MEKFEKLKIALEYQLLGKGYYKALHALNFARSLHTGLRKDGVTPEFKHPIDVCMYAMTLKGIEPFEEDLICAALLHDVREDYGIGNDEIETKFGKEVADTVESLTKKFRGIHKSTETYFEELAKKPVGALLKGCDRINNVSTMIGVFTPEKQASYIKEVETLFLPMLKNARKNHPELTFAFLNVETILKQQCVFVKAILES